MASQPTESSKGPSREPAPKEETFRSYTEQQGQKYAQSRPGYHDSVYDCIINQHAATGGQFDRLLDLGCGPGLATWKLALKFQHVVGADPSAGMIAAAQSLEGATASSEPIQFVVGEAETIGSGSDPAVHDGTVDLITAANAAHWFDMPRFWQRAAKLLRPGGSVAIWTTGNVRVHPDTVEAEKVQAALTRCDEDAWQAYYSQGNRLARGQYRDLPLPWTVDKPVTEFDKDAFFRKEWTPDEHFIDRQNTWLPLDHFEQYLSTASIYTRWVEAHPNDAGTERDVIKIMRREIETILHAAGVEKGHEKVKGMVLGVVLIVKKKI